MAKLICTAMTSLDGYIADEPCRGAARSLGLQGGQERLVLVHDPSRTALLGDAVFHRSRPALGPAAPAAGSTGRAARSVGRQPAADVRGTQALVGGELVEVAVLRPVLLVADHQQAAACTTDRHIQQVGRG